MSKKRIVLALCTVLLLTLLSTGPTKAQGQDTGWSEPYRLSTKAGKASEASLVADPYGYVHAFWTETLFESQQAVIEYARFDGGTWSAPNDIYFTDNGIENISSVMDKQGILHVVWTEGLYGPAYYMHAPGASALSAQQWTKPLRIDIPAGIVQFHVDSKGVFHILYINRGEALGVYYVRSKDRGETWSEPVWLDPDILGGHTPDSLNFEMDENDGLHAVWWYGALDRDARPDWVRYIHSLDGGETWSSPFMIDQDVEGSGHALANASPKMIVQGQNVHVIWAAGVLAYRFHRYSTDSGKTWSSSRLLFGELQLQGQAFDDLAVDGAGRVHFFGQIRYPIGIYHAYWDQTRWSTPSLVYLVAEQGEDMGHRIHAHLMQAVVRAGNQLVLTFGDPPSDDQRRLFVMYRTLDDVAPLKMLPTPTPAATMIPSPSPTPTQIGPLATPTLTITTADGPLVDAPQADRALQFGLIPVLLLLGGTIAFRVWYKQRS